MVLHCPLDINGCLLPTPFEEDVSREGAFKKRLAFCVLRKQSNTAEVLVTAQLGRWLMLPSSKPRKRFTMESLDQGPFPAACQSQRRCFCRSSGPHDALNSQVPFRVCRSVSEVVRSHGINTQLLRVVLNLLEHFSRKVENAKDCKRFSHEYTSKVSKILSPSNQPALQVRRVAYFYKL